MPDEQIGNPKLDSWKAIAAYLERDVRTVTRWEQVRGLPVHRLPGNARSGVYAFKADIDAWLRGQVAPLAFDENDIPSDLGQNSTAKSAAQRTLQPQSSQTALGRTFRGWMPIAFAVAVVLAVGISIHHSIHTIRANPTPALATFTTDSLQAWDDHHNLLWEYHFPEPLANTSAVGEIDPLSRSPVQYESTNRANLYDLQGDGRMEVLAITHFRRNGSPLDEPRQVLSCFSPAGKLLWSYEPQTVLKFGDKTYSAPWWLAQLIVSDEPGKKTIWIGVLEPIWGKSFVARLDADGHAAVQYVNSGEIAVLRRLHTPDGAMLWIGGFNDEYDTASLAVMRDTQTYAVSPQTPGTRYACVNCGVGDPFAYLVFPRYDMSRAMHIPNNKVYAITSDATTIEVHQAELSTADQVIYDFPISSEPKPVSVRYAATFWPNHLELERQGKLKHSLAECPDRLHPPAVRLYRNGEWTEVRLAAGAPR